MILQLTSSSGSSVKYTIIIKGDVNADGTVTAIDLLRTERHILNPTNNTLSEPSKRSANLNNDDKITAIDLLRMERYILNPSLYPLS